MTPLVLCFWSGKELFLTYNLAIPQTFPASALRCRVTVSLACIHKVTGITFVKLTKLLRDLQLYCNLLLGLHSSQVIRRIPSRFL